MRFAKISRYLSGILTTLAAFCLLAAFAGDRAGAILMLLVGLAVAVIWPLMGMPITLPPAS